MSNTPTVLVESSLTSLPLIYRGKVRDVYQADEDHLLIVATDRLSAFDVILPQGIPGKGTTLTKVSNFWFDRTRHIIPNHLSLSTLTLEQALPDPAERAQVQGRAVVGRKLKALPVEAIVRGYIIGSGWKDYQQTGKVCGIALPPGLKKADKLPAPVFTPSTKAEAGDHDENVSFDKVRELLGTQLAQQVRDVSLDIYTSAAEYALSRGIIIADTKFEFGIDGEHGLVLIDEILTPDSSRFWPADQYKPGTSPPSYDKQFVRDYLETLDWDKTAPGPSLPDEILEKSAEKYREAMRILTAKI